LKHLEEFGNIDEDLLDYLEKTRIEIDSITAQVGNQIFWNFIMDKLEKKFTTRDYTRAIDIPDYIAPKGIKEITDALAKKGSQITENLRDEITKEMENVEGFKDTQQTQIEINDRIASKILEDSDIKSFIIDLENIKTKYDWLNY
jgi:viroplasmin and RNaseH domain-containing protein